MVSDHGVGGEMDYSKFHKESLQFIQFISDKRKNDTSPFIMTPITSEIELQNIARAYMQDVFEEPERYVALPTANTLDYSRFFKNKFGKHVSTLTGLELLESYLDASNEQLRLWKLKKNGKLSSVKLKNAASISKRRVRSIRHAAQMLLETSKLQPTIAAQTLSFIMKFCVKVDEHGDMSRVKIKTNNMHSVMHMSDAILDSIQLELPYHQGFKTACTYAIAKHYDALKQQGMFAGWRVFEQSSSLEDAKKLQSSCIGTSWCIAEDVETASGFLKEGNFFIYYDHGDPVVTVHECAGCCESYGANKSQTVDAYYKPEVERFLMEQNLDHEIEVHRYLSKNDRCMIDNIVSSIHSGKLTPGLFKYVTLEADSERVLVNPIEISVCEISLCVHKQLEKIARVEDVLESHHDGRVTVHGNMDMGCNMSLLHRVIEIEGNLISPYRYDLIFPCLKYIGGYLDIRNANNINFPLLKSISGDLDAAGSSKVFFPALKEVQGVVNDWGGETYVTHRLDEVADGYTWYPFDSKPLLVV